MPQTENPCGATRHMATFMNHHRRQWASKVSSFGSKVRKTDGSRSHAFSPSRMFLLWWHRVLWDCCVWIASLLTRVRRTFLKGMLTSKRVAVGTLLLLL